MSPKSVAADPWKRTLLRNPRARKALHDEAKARGMDPAQYFDILFTGSLLLARGTMDQPQDVQIGRGPIRRMIFPSQELTFEEREIWLRQEAYRLTQEALIGKIDTTPPRTARGRRALPASEDHPAPSPSELPNTDETAGLVSLFADESLRTQRLLHGIFSELLKHNGQLLYNLWIGTPKAEIMARLNLSHEYLRTFLFRLREKRARLQKKL